MRHNKVREYDEAHRRKVEANENEVIAHSLRNRKDTSWEAAYIREVADDIVERRAATLYAEEG